MRTQGYYAFLLAVAITACGGDGATSPGGGSSNASDTTPALVVLAPAGPDTLVPGETWQLTPTVYTADNHVLSGQSVTYSSSDSAVATVSSTGLVTASGQYGTATVDAFIDGVVSAPVTIVVFTPVALSTPHAVALAQPFSSTLTVGESTPVQARVTNVYGNPIAGTTVSFTVSEGIGTLSPATAVTDANGIATTTWTVGTVLVQGNSIIARAGDAQVEISCAPLHGPAVEIAASVPFAGLTVGNLVRVDVTARDVYTNEFTPSSAQFVARDPSVLVSPTYPSPGEVTMTAQAVGQTYLVANVDGVTDSTLVAVFPDNGVLISVAPPSLALPAGGTFSTNVQMSRGPSTPPIGSLTATVTWDPAVLTYVSDNPPYGFDGSVTVNRTNVATGSLTIAAATGTSLGYPMVLRVLTFTASSTPNLHGMLGVTVSDISTNNFADLLPVTQVVSFPVRTR